MRTLALTAAMGLALCAGGVAFADTYTDPAGLLRFETPTGWRVQPQPVSGQSVVLTFNGGNDCFVYGIPNPASANATANAARNTSAPISAEAWVAYATPIRDFFEGAPPTLVSQSVDTSGFWPVQRAELRGPSKTVYGVVMLRPGVELRAFCAGAASASAYDAFFGSLGHPNDATWQAAATEQAAQQQAAQAAAAAAQQQQTAEQPAEGQRRRRNRD